MWKLVLPLLALVAWRYLSQATDRRFGGEPEQALGPLARLQKQARATRTGTPNLLRDVLDQFGKSGGTPLCPLVRERLLRAELAFRAGHGSGMSVPAITTGFNHLVDETGAPGYFHTSEEQVDVMINILASSIPDLLYPVLEGGHHLVSPAVGFSWHQCSTARK